MINILQAQIGRPALRVCITDEIVKVRGGWKDASMCIASEEKQPFGSLLRLCSLQTYTVTVSCCVPTCEMMGDCVLRKLA